jgi:lipoyl(octanoyl) transferase
MMKSILFQDIGPTPYDVAWDFQESLMRDNLAIKSEWYRAGSQVKPTDLHTKDYLLLCEHPHVYTLGKSGHMENLLVNDVRLRELGVSFVKTNRGGDITYHGPGQVVGYPILDLEHFETDLGKYMRNLEEVMIRMLATYGITAGRLPGSTGVWLDADVAGRARKICAMGVRCSRWVTMHGFALNVNTDLNYFNFIVPCGITDKTVTSMKKELGREVDMQEVKTAIKCHFGDVFGATITDTVLKPAPALAIP